MQRSPGKQFYNSGRGNSQKGFMNTQAIFTWELNSLPLGLKVMVKEKTEA